MTVETAAQRPGVVLFAAVLNFVSALLWLAVASVLTAPHGAKLAHRLPVARLKKILAVLLYFIATKMLVGVF